MMSALRVNIIARILMLLLSSCFSGIQTIDSREPHLFSRQEGGQVFKNPMKGATEKKSPEVFIRKRKTRINPKPTMDNSGSLYNLEDKNNRLFVTFNRPDLNDFLMIKILNQKALKDSEQTAEDGSQPAEDENELDEDKLIKSLPSLEPFDLKSKGILKEIKMKVMHRYDNGDLLLSYNRESVSEENTSLIKVSARLPAQYLDPAKELTTKDLADIHFIELGEEEVIDKSSSSWEDEYTLRLSGFSEADSKLAAELDVKRRELMDIKQQLENRLKSLGSERRQMAKERDTWIEKNKQADQKLAEANAKLEEQKQQIAAKDNELKEKNQEIEELTRPEEKPEANEEE